MLRVTTILLLLLWSQAVPASPGRGVEVGEAMPDIAMPTFAGDTISRSSVAGKPVLLVFWNTWCPTCLRELPQIGKLAEKFSPKELTVVAINTGLNDSESKARAFWKKHGYRFPVGFDHTFGIGQAFGIRGVPTVILVDAKGILRYKSTLPPDNMDERIRQLAGK